MIGLRVVVPVGVVGLLPVGVSASTGVAGVGVVGDAEVVPELVERYCYECHGDGVAKGGLAIDDLLAGVGDYAGLGEVGREAVWQKVWKMGRQELMPPVGEESPTADERGAMARWVEGAMLGVDHANPDPGRVTIRRLNRVEYEYTVTDLFGVEIVPEGVYSSDGGVARHRLRDQLPPDDTAFGFDNIGDFQSLSPALLEKYFGIAEGIVGQVIAFDGPTYPEVALDPAGVQVRVQAGRGEDREDDGGARPRVSHSVGFVAPEAGDYRVEVRFTLGGWQEFGGAFGFTMGVDGAGVAEGRLEVGGYETHVYDEVVSLGSGAHRLELATLAVEPDSEGRMQALELRPAVRVRGPMVAGTEVYPDAHRRVFFRGAAPEGEPERRAYAEEIVRRLAGRAFRRPADDATVARLTGIAMRHEEFERGVGEAITAVLVSPRFLFRAELQPRPDDPASVHPVDEWALASRLSYLLWLSLPDDELRELAAAGGLRANLGAQVARMLADPKSGRFFEDFAGQWLRTRNVLMTSISRRSDEVDPVRGDMKRETELFFEHIARGGRDLIELVTADYGFLNGALAGYYGVGGVEEGEGFRQVAFAGGDGRGGLLTQGSFLVSTSNPTRTSPVKRGLFVLENLLGVEPPPPPPATPSLEEAERDGERPRTVREQLVLHREDRACASCHAHFDPIGLVLENYDVVGKWRGEDDGEPIVTDETAVSGEQLRGVDDLKAYFLAKRSRFYRCVTEKLMTYALGRGLEPSDAVTVDAIAARVEAEGGRFDSLLTAVVESPAFQHRRGDDGRVVEPQRQTGPKALPKEERRRIQRERLERIAERRRQRAAEREAREERERREEEAPGLEEERGGEGEDEDE